jgi:tetratricopeptide (TPR) repeat protein
MGDLAKKLSERAEAVIAEGRWLEAIKILEAEPKLLEFDASLSWYLGWAYFKLDDYASAERHLARASRLQPWWAAAWWALGEVQREAGHFAEAARNLKRALELKDGAQRRHSLAIALREQGRFVEAEQVHLKGLELNPESGERWLNYGSFLEDVGRIREAAEVYKKARQLIGH